MMDLLGTWNALDCTNGQRGKFGRSDYQEIQSENRSQQQTPNTMPFAV